jgi:TorA maturation chaperone TorD
LEDATQLREEDALPVQLASYPVWRQLLQSLIDLGRYRPGELEDRYVSLFVVNSTSVPCPPYESACLEGRGPQAGGELLAEVEREYATAGLALPPATGEPPDHIALELEFLALLCEREAQAWEKRSPRRSLIPLRQQKAFLDRHLAVWLPAFSRRLAAVDGERAYAAIGEQANAFVSYDKDLLAALLEARPREMTVS